MSPDLKIFFKTPELTDPNSNGNPVFYKHNPDFGLPLTL